MACSGNPKPPLTLEELGLIFRQQADDLPGDVVSSATAWDEDGGDAGLLWSNEDIARYANEAQMEAAIRVPIIDEDTTPAITQVAFAAGAQDGDYDSRIKVIDRAKYVETASGDEHILIKKTQAWMDDNCNDWDLEGDASSQGTPKYFVEYAEQQSFKLSPVPELAGTVHMNVRRLPILDLTWGARRKRIEIRKEFQLDLVDFMLFRAYLKRDAEVENVNLSATHKALFDERMGERPSNYLQELRRRERKTYRRVKANFF